MKVLKYLYNKTREEFYKVISKQSKNLYDIGKKDTYTYLDEVFTKNKETYDGLLKKYSYQKDAWQEYWNLQEIWSVKKFFPKTFKAAKQLLFEDFLSLYEEKPILMDIGCASGEWTLMVAPYCEKIAGYEYSQKMVDTAILEAKNGEVKNVEFFQVDATTMELNCQYDGGMILAMLMYIDDINKIYKILKNVYSHLKPGAYLCTRESLNNENTDIVYLLNKKSGYTAFYWGKEVYYEQFRKAGFEMKKEVLLEEVSSRHLNFIHIGNIWQKPME